MARDKSTARRVPRKEMGKHDGCQSAAYYGFLRLVSSRLDSSQNISHCNTERTERQLKTVNLCTLLFVSTACDSRQCSEASRMFEHDFAICHFRLEFDTFLCKFLTSSDQIKGDSPTPMNRSHLNNKFPQCRIGRSRS